MFIIKNNICRIKASVLKLGNCNSTLKTHALADITEAFFKMTVNIV